VVCVGRHVTGGHGHGRRGVEATPRLMALPTGRGVMRDGGPDGSDAPPTPGPAREKKKRRAGAGDGRGLVGGRRVVEGDMTSGCRPSVVGGATGHR
jgi:hypothetical protein